MPHDKKKMAGKGKRTSAYAKKYGGKSIGTRTSKSATMKKGKKYKQMGFGSKVRAGTSKKKFPAKSKKGPVKSSKKKKMSYRKK